ncbi:MAG: hypothetical protein GXY32_03095 [Ruminococcaceae bacterium]|nr:hypothetical protein [Oscillospiraceae bacterium]
MKKSGLITKLSAMLLAFTLIFCTVPTAAFAQESPADESLGIAEQAADSSASDFEPELDVSSEASVDTPTEPGQNMDAGSDSVSNEASDVGIDDADSSIPDSAASDAVDSVPAESETTDSTPVESVPSDGEADASEPEVTEPDSEPDALPMADGPGGGPFLGQVGAVASDSKPISSQAELAKIGADPAWPLSGKYHLTANVDLAGAAWVPIGSGTASNNWFTGTFDGQGFVIRHLTITGDHQYAGLFGGARQATIKNVGLENTNINTTGGGTVFAGGICGTLDKGSIENCYSTGSVSATSLAGALAVGGICGNAYGAINNCYNTGAVTAGGSNANIMVYAGGICGQAYGFAIATCYNTGAVSAQGQSAIGGICGSADTINRCYNTGAVSAVNTGEISYAGGISGQASAIGDCYNTGAVSAATTSGFVYSGGISGSGNGEAAASRCYNLGEVTATAPSGHTWGTTVGGICAYAGAGSLTAVDCYAPQLYGSVCGTRLTTAQMKDAANFAGFDFVNVWNIVPTANQGYPFLRGFPAPAADIVEPAQIVKVKLSQTSLRLVAKNSATVSAIVLYADGSTSGEGLVWSSSKTSVAKVQNGKITAGKKAGSAKITATAENGKSATVTVKVVKKAVKATKVAISGVSQVLGAGQTATLKAKISPSSATGAAVKWKSSNPSVARIDAVGNLTAINAGSTKITLSAGKKTARITVRVLAGEPVSVLTCGLSEAGMKKDIKKRWKSVSASGTSSIYASQPSTKAPFRAGSLTQAAQKDALNALNFCRYLSGLPAVSAQDDLTSLAQHAAVINAAQGGLSHYPARLEDMSQSFYEAAYNGSRSSNLAYGYGTLTDTIFRGWMWDEDASNIDRVGHRRWALNPGMQYTGFGQAGTYTAMYAIDRSREEAVDYEAIAYPAGPAFPNNLFAASTPWSISLNPKQYQAPELADIKVTLTGGGKTWVFTKAKSKFSGNYLNVSTEGYGSGGCIIFRPSGVSAYSGDYTVTVEGLKDIDGAAVHINYTVNFFSL